MDYIFKEWEKKLSAFEDSVEKKLEDIRQCKEDMQQLKVELTSQMQSGRYLRDDQRLILSAPEVIIGNVDADGLHYAGTGSSIVIRGNQVSLQGVGEGGQVDTRAASILQTAEDPGIDGLEHVVTGLSQVVSQARNIVIQSDDADGTFSAVTTPTGGSGVRIHADKTIEIGALATAESREQRLTDLISTYNNQKDLLKQQASDYKSSFDDLRKELEDLLDDKAKLVEDDNGARSSYMDIYDIDEQIERLSGALADAMSSYSQTLSMLSEANRQIDCFTKEKDAITKGDDFKTKTTGTSVSIAAESISLSSLDGEGNIRDNEGAGISILGNEVSIASVETDGKLKEKGQVRIQAKTVGVTTAGSDNVEIDEEDGALKTADHTAEGDIILTSKNITLESLDYEVKEKKLQEKALTQDGRISVRAKTVEVSTENSANVEVDDTGVLTKVNYTAEGDLIVRSKTVTVESVDYDLENGEKTEKALTAEGKVSIRAEKTDLSATDTEGKATGSINVNAKAVNVKTMDVDKDSKADSALAAGSTMVLVSEKMFVGAKSSDVKSKKVQVVSEEVGAFADNTLEIQQGDGKALVQLEGGNASVGGSKTQLYGDTTVNAKTEIKGELSVPKATIDSLQAKSEFKSPNIKDGMPGAPAASGGSLSAKLQTEDAPEEK